MSRSPFITGWEVVEREPALRTTAQSYTYGDLRKAVYESYQRLKGEGVAEGKTVFLDGDYSLASVSYFFALYLNKNIVALNTVANEREVEDRIALVDPIAVIKAGTGAIRRRGSEREVPTLVARLHEKRHSGLVLFSSGTTGAPKMMLHDLDTLVESYLRTRKQRLEILLFLMFDHIGGINTLLRILAGGSVATIPQERTPDHVCELIQRYKICVLPASPTFLNLLLMSDMPAKYDLGSLRIVSYGTEAMPESLLAKLRKALPKAKLLQTFGTSETGIIQTQSRSSDSLFMKFSDEKVEHKIVEGELWLRGERQIIGYLNHDSDALTSDGWFRTGDLVEEAEDGFLRIKGRCRDVINVGGQKVFPVEVESTIMQIPFVRNCRAFAGRNAITGQSVHVDVSVSNEVERGRRELVKQIQEYALERMDPYKVPTKINIVADVPYSHNFKKSYRRTECEN